MKFLSNVARKLGVAEHVYVVGGAVRNFLIGAPIKDIDVVVDSVGLKGKDSGWFAEQVQKAIPVRANLTTNQYGVAILSISEPWELDGHEMKGETIEIANARKESYGGEEGKGYKPHLVEPATIHEDLARREFTFNTLLWRLLDLEHGPGKAEVLDLTGLGKKHLEERILSTPVDPDKTFGDDPTRMLRAIKFVAKYGFKIPNDVAESIRRNAPMLKRMPWDAVRKIVTDDILDGPAPRRSVELMQELGLAQVLKEMLHETPGFAAALGRSLSEADIHLLLDLLDLGWAFKTPVGFLDRDGQLRLREVLLEHADDPAFEKAFVSALQKPPVDQQRLFTEYAIPPKERQSVSQIARRLLLDKPNLVSHGLVEAVEEEVARRYSKASMPERVAKRFLLR
jgi:tRNA nucleotidyltransferase/poly(A) polymerase